MSPCRADWTSPLAQRRVETRSPPRATTVPSLPYTVTRLVALLAGTQSVTLLRIQSPRPSWMALWNSSHTE